jgi:glycosyltransferase involved in cell wall biosynthesis
MTEDHNINNETLLNNKTLLILSPAFPPDESAEQSPWLPAQQSLVRSLNRNFPLLEIIILAFQFPVSKTEYRWQGNRVIPFGGVNKRRGRNLLLWCKVFRVLRTLKKNKNILGIISFWCSECCLTGSYFGRIYGIRHLCWISGQDAKKGNKFVMRIHPKASELVAMSDFLTEEFHKNYQIRPQFLIPDAIDPSLFPETQAERTIDILGVGNLIPLKQYDIFIKVIASITDKNGPLKVMLCGSGPEEAKLKNLIKQAGLENTVCLTGLRPHKEILELMKRTRVFLHTSQYEGFGNVCIEALYAGAHVISFTRPMRQSIPHWHIVSTKEDMISQTSEILQNRQTEYTSVFPFDMNDSAKKFISVFTDPQ